MVDRNEDEFIVTRQFVFVNPADGFSGLAKKLQDNDHCFQSSESPE